MTDFFDDESYVGVTVLGSGSKGNATLIHRGHEAIMIDAGFCYREILRRFECAGLPKDMKVRGIFVTHEHSDHIKGLRLCSERMSAPVYATSMCAGAIRAKDVKLGRCQLIASGSPVSLCDFNVMPFTIPHDATDPVAYIVTAGGTRIGVATDLGMATHMITYTLNDCQCLVLESNHDKNMLAASARPWELKQRILSNYGHLCNEATADLLEKIASPRLQSVILAHISGECNTHERAYAVCEERLRAMSRSDVVLQVAHQDEPLQTQWVKA